jgi:hypothetical protein
MLGFIFAAGPGHCQQVVLHRAGLQQVPLRVVMGFLHRRAHRYRLVRVGRHQIVLLFQEGYPQRVELLWVLLYQGMRHSFRAAGEGRVRVKLVAC